MDVKILRNAITFFDLHRFLIAFIELIYVSETPSNSPTFIYKSRPTRRLLLIICPTEQIQSYKRFHTDWIA